MPSSAAIGERIRAGRDRLGFTQAELAQRAGLRHPQIVSQIELGQREVKAVELVRLARALHVSVETLLADAELQPARILWRARPEGNAELVGAKFLEVWQQYKRARDAVWQAEAGRSFPSQRINLATLEYAEVARLADDLSRHLDLGSCPAASLAEVLEGQFGFLIWYEDLDQGGSAACTRDEGGCAVLINRNEAPWRRNYDLAHELFHLLTWESADPEAVRDDSILWDKMEKHAQRFAAQLLLPAESVLREFNVRCRNDRVRWADLIAIAREFRVSTEALLWRLVELRQLRRKDVQTVLDNEEFRALDRSERRGAWFDPPPKPESYVRAGFLAYTQGRMSRARLAQYLGVSLIDLARCLEQYGLSEGEFYSNVIGAC